ncbi:hypothetical protein [Pedobacter sp.]
MKKLFLALLVAATIHVNAQEKVANKATTSSQKFRFALNGGFSRLLAKTSTSLSPQNKAYVDQLKSGVNFGVDAGYFVAKDWGLGLKFNQFRSSHTGLLYDANNFAVSASTDLVNTFFGPSFSTKYDSQNNKHMLMLSAAIGYMHYWSHNGFIKTTGGTVGSALDFGYDYRVTKNFALGAQLSFVGGALSKLTQTNGSMSVTSELEDNKKESMARLDISIGARFNF